jgi:diguanylate cyclase (GGDEF)-like protein/PAS domain S-box-containing protein
MAPESGLVELYGPEISRAARIACDEINERGGVLGQPLELIVEDDGSLPNTAVPAAKRLLDEHHCVALIGNLLSNSRIAVAEKVAQPRQVPYLNFSFYEGSISSRYFFNFAALPNQQIEYMIPFMARRYGPKMFFAGNNYEWPRGSIDAAKAALQKLGGDIVGEEYLSIGVPAADIDRLLNEVALSGCDVFVPYFAGQDQITLLTRFNELGLKHRMAVVMGHFDEAMVSHLSPAVREGLYSCNTYFMSLETAENNQIKQRLAHAPGVSGVWPHGNGVITNFGEGAYICVHAFANAAEAAGSLEPEALVNALEGVRVLAPQGVVEMDRDTHHAHVNTCLSRCNADGSFSIVEQFGQLAPTIPERYQAQFRSARLHASPVTPELTARLAAEIGQAQQRLGTAQRILSVADMAIIATDLQGLITEANLSASQIFGYEEGELLGLSVHVLVPPQFRNKHAEHIAAFVTGEETERRMSRRGEIMGYRKDGSLFPLEASIAKFRTGTEDWQLVVTMRDITERKKSEEELTRRATHDSLTGLPNRALIRERLANALHRSRRSGLSVVLMFVDIDGFKPINDTHGHNAGDELLKILANRLIEQVRPGDTVARLGGDEFIVLCEQVEQPWAMSVMAERINDSLRLPVVYEGHSLFVSASVGIAIGNGGSHTADDMLRQSDTAMYAVKQKGRDGWAFFNESQQEQARQRLAITNGLRLAIEREEFSLRYQPIVATETGRIVGAEVLLRWRPPQGEISPALFIPVAESTGAIVAIGTWVFRSACQTVVEWRSRWGQHAPYISVNLSTRQLGEVDLVDEFAAILAETGADPEGVLLEITETSLMADVEGNLRVLRRLSELGLRVAVDDFGTGYSSLAQLTRLPVSVLKIDRAFVDGIEKSSEARTVIRAVIGLGRSLGLKLVAEGVETSAQRLELCAYGCDFAQGYFFYRPLEGPRFIETYAEQLDDKHAHTTSTLHTLLYVCKARQAMTAQELETLREQAASSNRAAGISGCLLYRDGCFMQLLEGQRDRVRALYDQIRRDSRITDCQLVLESHIEARTFHDWGMAMPSMPNTLTEVSTTHKRHITFLDVAEDARFCYEFIAAHARGIES